MGSSLAAASTRFAEQQNFALPGFEPGIQAVASQFIGHVPDFLAVYSLIFCT